ncbi:hypothetical protein [Streptomyces sp. NPDC001205]
MLVTLTGGAGAGKTTLAAALAATASQAPARVLHGDDYYFQAPEHGAWAPDDSGTLRLDVGDPRSLVFEGLVRDIDAALVDSPVVIVEGLFARHVAPQTAKRASMSMSTCLPTSAWPGRLNASAYGTASPSMSFSGTTSTTGALPATSTSSPYVTCAT